jgi:hypothetical protein
VGGSGGNTPHVYPSKPAQKCYPGVTVVDWSLLLVVLAVLLYGTDESIGWASAEHEGSVRSQDRMGLDLAPSTLLPELNMEISTTKSLFYLFD